MKITPSEIQDLLIIDPKVYGDQRGYFMESFNAERFRQATGLDVSFVQDNESLSRRGVVRGLHYQLPPYAQAKLVRVVKGCVWDVVVDLRRSSPTFGRYMAVELSAENKRQLFIPKGLAHGFAVLSEEAIFQYKCDAYYHPEAEGAVAWNDPTLNIPWPILTEEVILSEKDKNHPLLADAPLFE
ncbi:MAG: dTDP-4-dehydrorhamnose 3,5-epimerase [Rikenellaceae bacterium]|nr:dTDP-4-dehydrorhamnose 3,5-epimerase [Rikenellaceae bacterium]